MLRNSQITNNTTGIGVWATSTLLQLCGQLVLHKASGDAECGEVGQLPHRCESRCRVVEHHVREAKPSKDIKRLYGWLEADPPAKKNPALLAATLWCASQGTRRT